MKKIAVIDDDYASEIVVENLRHRGFDARRIKSAADAFASLDDIASCDLVILDMIMARPSGVEPPPLTGDAATGMSVFHAIRERQKDLPVLFFTASRDGDIVETLKSFENTSLLAKWATPSLKDIFERVEKLTGSGEQAKPRAFIVHGRDEKEKLALKNYLQNTLGLPEPIILHEQPSMGRTIIEKFEDISATAELAFVLLTPDDAPADADSTNTEKRRARQNVIFEMGFFIGVFGRNSGRVILLHKGPLDVPSDLNGVIYIDISKGVDAAGEEIRREVAHVLR